MRLRCVSFGCPKWRGEATTEITEIITEICAQTFTGLSNTAMQALSHLIWGLRGRLAEWLILLQDCVEAAERAVL